MLVSLWAFADVIITIAAAIANNVRFIIQIFLRVITCFSAAKIRNLALCRKGETICLCMVFPKVKGEICVYPKSVIRPFNVIFYNCLQSFAFYKVSFACF